LFRVCNGRNGGLEKEKRKQAPALHMEFSTESIIRHGEEKSRKIFCREGTEKSPERFGKGESWQGEPTSD
jgi:hypothetical protein